MGWKPSYKGKGTAFTPEQQLERQALVVCADARMMCSYQVGKPLALAT